MRKPKFEIFAGKDGKFYFRLKAANGEPIMSGRAYDSKPGVVHGIATVMTEALEETRFVRKTSANLKYFFQLRSKTGRLIGWSELYETRQGRDNGIRAVQTAAQWGRIADLADPGKSLSA
jgi:uncharacterized protein YegP (UPF0339 family)